MASLAPSPASGVARRVSLRVALKLDAVVTGANGAAYLLAAAPLGDLLGLSPTLLRVLGALLLAFAAAVWLTAARPDVPRQAALAIVGSNAVWAIGTVAALIGGWVSPTTVGTLWIVAQAIVVVGFVELQAVALKR